MPRTVRCSLIQASNAVPATETLAVQKEAMIDKHLGLIRKAAADGAQRTARFSGRQLDDHRGAIDHANDRGLGSRGGRAGRLAGRGHRR